MIAFRRTAVFFWLSKSAVAGWPISEFATGHDAMVTAPVATADLLEKHSA